MIIPNRKEYLAHDIQQINKGNYPDRDAIYVSNLILEKKNDKNCFTATVSFNSPDSPKHIEVLWDHVAIVLYGVLISQVSKVIYFALCDDIVPIALAKMQSSFPNIAYSLNDLELKIDGHVMRIDSQGRVWVKMEWRFAHKETDQEYALFHLVECSH